MQEGEEGGAEVKEAEGLRLHLSGKSQTGYRGVSYHPKRKLVS